MAKYARGWDLASSTKKTADYTASVKLCKTDIGMYVIEDYFRYRKNTYEVETLLLDTAKKDGIRVKQIIAVDPGQAGESQKMHLLKLLDGFNIEFVRDNRSKLERALPISAQVLGGNVRVVKNRFYLEFMDELEAFSDDDKTYLHDDMVDALATSYNALLKTAARFRTDDEIGLNDKYKRTFGGVEENSDWMNKYR